VQDRSLYFKLGLLACLYFSQGLPFGFFSHALPVLMRSYGVDLEVIGLMSFLGLPWALKFLWAPWVDRHGSARIGQRKSWILPLQLASMLVLLALSLLDPQQLRSGGWLYLFLLLGLANLLAATQDIATDGLAVQSLHPRERGLANGIQVGGYRVGMVFGGGLVLVLLDYLGWEWSFRLLALVILLVTIPVLLYREAPVVAQPRAWRQRPALHALVAFVRKPGMWAWLLLLMLYKVGDSFGSAMGKPLLVDLGWSLEVIGWVGGGVGMGAGIAGAMVGGYLVQRIGRVRALVGFGVLQALGLCGYAWLAATGPDLAGIVAVNAVEHFVGGMATAALFTLMMDACRHEQAGSDYSIQASLQVSIVGLAHGFSGFSAGYFGYEAHFLLAAAACLLALLVVPLWLRRLPESQRNAWHQS
jgi:PAT family beta-lactamase induction signal transducer AmpG